MFQDAVGRYGSSPQEIASLSSRLTKGKRAILKSWKDGDQGWMGCPDQTDLVVRIERLVRAKKSCDTCLIIGIGGSDLGSRAAYHALGGRKGMRLVFAGANTDPDELAGILSSLDLKKTLVNVISKSGDTVEPMATFLIVRDALIRAVGAKKAASHIVATTDESSGGLLELARAEGYDTLPVPQNIGGRFSVLTAVGLFPLACAGIDIRSMLKGAGRVRDAFAKEQPDRNAASVFAALHVMGDMKRGQDIHVLMPYAARLQEFGRWFRQLWAESLGKKYNREKDIVYNGPTPVAALGATDQHSQLQLYVEGPQDKIVTFIEVRSFGSGLRIPASAKALPGLAYLAGVPLAKIIHAERAASAEALRGVKRPNGTLMIPSVSPESIGALFQFFAIATAMAGELYDINAYDQPGVEAGKRAMNALLGKPGTASDRKRLTRSTLKPKIL